MDPRTDPAQPRSGRARCPANRCAGRPRRPLGAARSDEPTSVWTTDSARTTPIRSGRRPTFWPRRGRHRMAASDSAYRCRRTAPSGGASPPRHVVCPQDRHRRALRHERRTGFCPRLHRCLAQHRAGGDGPAAAPSPGSDPTASARRRHGLVPGPACLGPRPHAPGLASTRHSAGGEGLEAVSGSGPDPIASARRRPAHPRTSAGDVAVLRRDVLFSQA